MKELTWDESNSVSGGVVVIPFAPIVTVVLAVVAAGAYLGEKMAERDNRETNG